MPIRTVDASTLKHWLETDDAIIVDVREPAEHMSEKIKGATLLPLNAISQNDLPPTQGKKLVIHCRSGKRSTNACEKLLAKDPELEVYNLEGGISAWEAAGYPVVRPDMFFLPLDRQMHLVIGLLLITCSLLGYILSPIWFLLTGIIGAGLTISGLTGFCGLAMIIAWMPWNRPEKNTPSCHVK